MIKYSIWNGSKKDLDSYNDLLNIMFKSRKYETEYFYWKHLNNPLGKSIITYAKVDGKLVGARAIQPTLDDSMCFMQPCDTVTHYEYQGRGVFTQLTELALNNIEPNVGVINFPNHLSLPAYLKAGWEIHKPIKPNIGLSFFKSILKFKKISIDQAFYLLSFIGDKKLENYYKWRFFDNPCAKYTYYKVDNSGLVIVNNKRMSYKIIFDKSVKSKIHNKDIPFLCYSYYGDQKFNLIEKVIHKFLNRGSNVVFLKSDFYKSISSMREIEVSGLMDTF